MQYNRYSEPMPITRLRRQSCDLVITDSTVSRKGLALVQGTYIVEIKSDSTSRLFIIFYPTDFTAFCRSYIYISVNELDI